MIKTYMNIKIQQKGCDFYFYFIKQQYLTHFMISCTR